MARRVFYPRLESLRGVAALSVVLFHVLESQATYGLGLISTLGWWQGFPILLGQTIFNGGAAVWLFFVLSGFVMGANIDTTSPLSFLIYGRFLLRRFFRLVPVIAAAIAIVVIVQSTFAGEKFSPQRVADFFLLNDLSVDPPLWSLKVEIVASIFYPIVLFGIARSGLIGKAAWLMAGLFYDSVVAWPIFMRQYAIAFVLGLFVPTLGKQLIVGLGGRRSTLLLPIVFGCFAGSIFLWTHKVVSIKLVNVDLAFGAFFIVSWVLFADSHGVGLLLDTRAARYFGRISYSLYVLHQPILSLVVEHISLPLLPKPVILNELLTLVVALPISLLAAHVSYELIEKPTLALGRYLTGNIRGRSLASAERSETIPT